MSALHISEADLARDLHAVLERVRQGSEIIVEQDRRPVAIMRPPPAASAPTMSEIIAAMEAGAASGFVDEDFARDVEAGVAALDEPWNPLSRD